MSRKLAVPVAAGAMILVVLIGYLLVSGNDGHKAAHGDAAPKPTASPIQPAPNGGKVTETEAPGKPGATVKAKITRTAELSNGVKIKVLSTEIKSVKNHGPGEGGGPAVIGRLEIENRSKGPIDVSGAIVTLIYGHNQVAEPSDSAPSSPFRGTLKRGETGRGTYVFRVLKKSDSPSSVVVQYGAGTGVARFVS